MDVIDGGEGQEEGMVEDCSPSATAAGTSAKGKGKA